VTEEADTGWFLSRSTLDNSPPSFQEYASRRACNKKVDLSKQPCVKCG